jgi:hypothetical protein
VWQSMSRSARKATPPAAVESKILRSIPGGSLLRSLEPVMHRAAGADPEVDPVHLLAWAFVLGPGRGAQPQRDISGLHGFTDRPRQVLAEPLQVGLLP